MKNAFQFETRDPDQFETIMAPMVGQVHVQPVQTTAFDATVTVRRLEKTVLFTVLADSIHVNVAPALNATCLDIALGKPFTITNRGQKKRFLDDIHVLRPDRELLLEARNGCCVLVAYLHSKHTEDYMLKLGVGNNSPSNPGQKDRIESSNPTSRIVVRAIANLWTATQQTGSGPCPDIHVQELEDALITSFVLAGVTTTESSRHRNIPASAHAITRAEEYLCAHLTHAVSRADMAAAAGVSISTLSRGFAKRHDTGPMGFLKARRLNAAYMELLGSEPGSTTVTKVATRYGFYHLGKFSLAYKHAFSESPSATLQHN